MLKATTAAGLVGLLLLACSGCSDSNTGGGSCVPGRVESCPCLNGAGGAQTCQDDGTWGACQCAGLPDADAVAADAPDQVSADAAGTPDGVAGEAGGADAAPNDTPAAPDTRPVDAADAIPAPDIPYDSAVTVVDGGWGDVAPSDHCEPCGYGAVKGVVCAPNRQVFVSHALVTLTAIDCDGATKTYQTLTDADGIYFFPEVPCGLHTVHVQAGSWTTTYALQVTAGKLNDNTGAVYKLCFQANSRRIAVLWGQWDEQHELVDELGFDYDYFNFQQAYFNDTPWEDIDAVKLLRDPTQLAAYDVIFFNCGSAALNWVKTFPEIGDNLAQFVLAGGSMYASDLSWAYIEAAFPDAIDFYGADDLPGGPMANDGPQQVQGNEEYQATVEDEALAGYIGTAAFTTVYGAGPLIAVQAPGASTTVHVRGTVHVDPPSPPVCGDGICDGSEVFGCSDCASIFDVDDYAEHEGPMVLSHRPSATSGYVIYTTFHNDEQADELMRNILNYLVFLL